MLAAEELIDDRFAGAIKLNKVLFFAEFAHMRVTGRPITGSPYQKLRLGPAPRRLVPVRNRLISAGDATLERETILGRVQHRLRLAGRRGEMSSPTANSSRSRMPWRY